MTRQLTVTVDGVTIRATMAWTVVVVLLAGITLYVNTPAAMTSNQQLIWIASVAVVIFGGILSLLLHEIAHIAVARKYHHPVLSLVPAYLGSLPDTVYEPENPRQEVKVAIAGPIANLVLGSVLALVWLFLPDSEHWLVRAFGIVAALNGVLALVNILPGAPFDGGRIFRAFIWYISGNLILGTRWSAFYGYVLMTAGLAAGVLLISAGEFAAVWGAWVLLIFWTLNRAVGASTQHIVWLEMSRRLKVNDLFVGSGRRLQASTTIDDAIEMLLEAYNKGPTLVIEDGQAIGMVDLSNIRPVPRSIWTERTVGDVLSPLDDRPKVKDDAPLTELLNLLPPDSDVIVLIERRGNVVAATNRELVIESMRDFLHAEHMEKLRSGLR